MVENERKGTTMSKLQCPRCLRWAQSQRDLAWHLNEEHGEWTPIFEPWRHGGWYVMNVRYPSGAVGCVSRNYSDGKWRIACDPRPFEEQPTFRTRDEAARAERALVESMRGGRVMFEDICTQLADGDAHLMDGRYWPQLERIRSMWFVTPAGVLTFQTEGVVA